MGREREEDWNKAKATMTALALRSIGRNDYAVIDDGHRVGRIRYAGERTNEVSLLTTA